MADEKPGTVVTRFRNARRDPTIAVLEGLHAVKHAQRFGAELLEIAVRDVAEATSLAATLAPELLPVLERARVVDPETYRQLSPAPHATGVMALARKPRVDAPAVFAAPGDAPIVLLERPTHLANIGAAVRVAAAARAAALFTLGGEDPWRPAALRGGAGLHFALPVARIDTLPATDRPLIAIDPEGTPLDEVPLPRRAVLLFGSERTGLSAALLGSAQARIRIPMSEGVSSLNLATAVAVVLYSAAR